MWVFFFYQILSSGMEKDEDNEVSISFIHDTQSNFPFINIFQLLFNKHQPFSLLEMNS